MAPMSLPGILPGKPVFSPLVDSLGRPFRSLLLSSHLRPRFSRRKQGWSARSLQAPRPSAEFLCVEMLPGCCVSAQLYQMTPVFPGRAAVFLSWQKTRTPAARPPPRLPDTHAITWSISVHLA